jgi:hypothetical protein
VSAISKALSGVSRYQVKGQSVPCPDGYDRTIYYLWDNKDMSILATHTLRSVIEAKIEKLTNPISF